LCRSGYILMETPNWRQLVIRDHGVPREFQRFHGTSARAALMALRSGYMVPSVGRRRGKFKEAFGPKFWTSSELSHAEMWGSFQDVVSVIGPSAVESMGLKRVDQSCNWFVAAVVHCTVEDVDYWVNPLSSATSHGARVFGVTFIVKRLPELHGCHLWPFFVSGSQVRPPPLQRW